MMLRRLPYSNRYRPFLFLPVLLQAFGVSFFFFLGGGGFLFLGILGFSLIFAFFFLGVPFFFCFPWFLGVLFAFLVLSSGFSLGGKSQPSKSPKPRG